MGYFLFEDDDLKLDLVFEEDELADFKELWEAEISLQNIAKKMKRRPSEIALLVFDHAERGIIKSRDSGMFGL
ncbi:hypothetical protein [Planomicrobium sp. YIM 101495]|uniref:hypothetical protein n=1 Tax=Planomicrobium sp. YIM 101495 TaxID=2665160 RepID=UPI0012B96C4B|nr:hypothetical protein [Planomicrobium sp. YIM 101495]MTD30174.1 hypothetical protein [Planomicrobium sp. YIM 101495]